MVNEQVVNDTISRMLEAEIDEDTIISTLKDIGLSETQSKEMIEKVKSSNNKDDSSDEGNSSSNENSNSDNDSQENSNENSSNFDDSESDEELDTLENVKKELEKNNVGEKIEDDFNKKSESIKDNQSISEKTEIKSNSTSINGDAIEDLNAKVNALSSLMKQVLEVNRKILTELESKK